MSCHVISNDDPVQHKFVAMKGTFGLHVLSKETQLKSMNYLIY